MSADIMSFINVQDCPEAVIVHNGDHRASAAAVRTGRDAREIELLPFDLSVLENEGSFVELLSHSVT